MAKKKSKMKKLVAIAAGAGVAYLGSGFLLHELFLVRPDRRKPECSKAYSVDPATIVKYKKDPLSIPDEKEWFYALGTKDTSIISLRGETIHSNVMTREEPTDKWVIICHGYTSPPVVFAKSGQEFYNMGYNVLYPHLSGHGLHEYRATNMGWLDRLDVLDWITYIITNNPDAQIVLYGVSMGAATVMMTTGEHLPENVKCAIEDCGFTSVWDEFNCQIGEMAHLPAFPFLNAARTAAKMHSKFDIKEASALKQIKKSTTPTLFMHGDQDTFVPFWMLDVLYDNAACEKEKVVIEGAAHANSLDVNPELYWGSIRNFVGKYIK